MNKIAASLVFLSLVGPLQAKDFDSIKIKEGIQILDQQSFSAESPSISDDGKQICWIAKARDSKLLIPSDIFVSNIDGSEKRHVSKGGLLNAFTKCSFDHEGNLVTSKLHWRPFALTRTIVLGIIHGDFDPVGYVSSISTLDHTDKVLSDIRPKDLGLPSDRIFLKHPKVSPDGKWLTYYLKDGKHEGVFVHHLVSGKTYQLSYVYDKHPTWTPDGTKIMFHYQIDAKNNQPEMAYLGYFDIKLADNGDLISSKRIMLDDANKVGFRYQKHPAALAGTNYVFFHGEEKAGDKKDIFVRKLKAGSKIYKLKMEINDVKITKAKHPASGAFTDSIVFVGKIKGADEEMVLRLTPQALENVTSELE